MSEIDRIEVYDNDYNVIATISPEIIKSMSDNHNIRVLFFDGTFIEGKEIDFSGNVNIK